MSRMDVEGVQKTLESGLHLHSTPPVQYDLQLITLFHSF